MAHQSCDGRRLHTTGLLSLAMDSCQSSASMTLVTAAPAEAKAYAARALRKLADAPKLQQAVSDAALSGLASLSQTCNEPMHNSWLLQPLAALQTWPTSCSD